jgi:L-rhamnose mutarotase
MSSESFTPAGPIYGPTNPDEEKKKADPVKRFAAVIELNPEKEKQYRELHANVWPEVRSAIKKAGFRNFSIFTVELNGKKYLFNYQEYTGDDLDSDIASLVENPTVRDDWLPLTDACQIRLPGTPEGEQWTSIEMLMHLE